MVLVWCGGARRGVAQRGVILCGWGGCGWAAAHDRRVLFSC